MEMSANPERRSEGPNIGSLRRQAQVFLTLFIVGVVLSGLTAVPIRTGVPSAATQRAIAERNEKGRKKGNR
jgi:hypothetical protein